MPKTLTHNFEAQTSVFAEVTIEKLSERPILLAGEFSGLEDYDHFWTVKTASNSTFYVGKGYNKKSGRPGDKGEHVMWYPNGKMYFGSARNLKDIVNLGLTNAFRYM